MTYKELVENKDIEIKLISKDRNGTLVIKNISETKILCFRMKYETIFHKHNETLAFYCRCTLSKSDSIKRLLNQTQIDFL